MDRYHASLLRLAITFVSSHAVAEEVVQETWIGVLEGIGRFEERSSLKTWIFRILTNQAKTRGMRERRHAPSSPLEYSTDESETPAADPSRFHTTGYWIDHWKSLPRYWDDETPERLFLSKEGLAQIEKAISALPQTQRQVITLRDMEGLTAVEVCNILSIGETHQRVLLHRARSHVRRALEKYLDQGDAQS
ncbi:MAG: putative RNA polymerase sigma-E factor (Sigma-24) [Nitrospira sp.]